MNCFRCGKELPPGDVSGECEDGCLPPSSPATGEAAVMFYVTMSLRLKRAVQEDPAVRAAFEQHVAQWMQQMRHQFLATGLDAFCERMD